MLLVLLFISLYTQTLTPQSSKEFTSEARILGTWTTLRHYNILQTRLLDNSVELGMIIQPYVFFFCHLAQQQQRGLSQDAKNRLVVSSAPLVTQYCLLLRFKPEGTANWFWEPWREETSGTNIVLSYAGKCKFPCQLSPEAVGGEGTSGTVHEFSGTRLKYSSLTNPGTWPNSSSATKPSARRHCGDPPALPSLALSLCKTKNWQKRINVTIKQFVQ